MNDETRASDSRPVPADRAGAGTKADRLAEQQLPRGALANFLDQLLAVDDEASLLGFNHETKMLGRWTTERGGMRAKLDQITPSGGTALYDAIDGSLPLFESRLHPRAAILLVSDGADTASDTTPTALKQKLVRSDVFLYAIGIDSLDARHSTRINPYTLNELTSQGGGYTVSAPAGGWCGRFDHEGSITKVQARRFFDALFFAAADRR